MTDWGGSKKHLKRNKHISKHEKKIMKKKKFSKYNLERKQRVRQKLIHKKVYIGNWIGGEKDVYKLAAAREKNSDLGTIRCIMLLNRGNGRGHNVIVADRSGTVVVVVGLANL